MNLVRILQASWDRNDSILMQFFCLRVRCRKATFLKNDALCSFQCSLKRFQFLFALRLAMNLKIPFVLRVASRARIKRKPKNFFSCIKLFFTAYVLTSLSLNKFKTEERTV